MSSNSENQPKIKSSRRSPGFSLRDLLETIAHHRSEPLYGTADGDTAKEIYRKILPLCSSAGITRLGDLTGLDRTGLPVAQAIRPEALSEVTSLGRGLSVAMAAVGAIMEALERYFAERIAPERLLLTTADDLKIADGLFEHLRSPSDGFSWRQRTIPWVPGINLENGREHPVPLELVHTRYIEPPSAHDGLFIRTTTGLACHVSFHRAVIHGLMECIERDAIARAFETHGFFERFKVSPAELGGKFQDMLSLSANCGISVAVWHAPSPTGVPVIWCQTIETGAGEPLLALPTEGYCAGPTVEDAAFNALLEALAARAGAISGARDDQTRSHYRKRTDELAADARNLILEQPLSPHDAMAASTEVSNLGDLIARVSSADLGPVLVVPLGSDVGRGVACARTILPKARMFSMVR